MPEMAALPEPAADYIAAARGVYSEQTKFMRAASARIAALEKENQRLRDQIAVLEETNGAADLPRYVRLGLTATEALLFALLVKRGEASIDQIMATLYSGRSGDEPGPKIIQVWISRIRKKLRPHGIRIWSRYRFGVYWLDAEARAKVRALVGEAQP